MKPTARRQWYWEKAESANLQMQLNSNQINKYRNVAVSLIVAYLFIAVVGNILLSPDLLESAKSYLEVQQESKSFKVYRNISYSLAGLGSVNKQLSKNESGDLYLPNKTDKTNSSLIPLIISIHGGSWLKGSKSDLEEQIMSRFFAEHGYAVFAIDYRLLSDGAKYPSNIEDIKEALAWAKVNANKYSFDLSHLYLIGSSSAAPAALVAAYTSQDPKINAACSISGLNDLTLEAKNEYLQEYFGQKGQVPSRELLTKASVISYLASAIPTIFVHGDMDKNVSIEQSKTLAEKLSKLNVPTSMITVSGQSHFIGALSRKQFLVEVLKFFQNH